MSQQSSLPETIEYLVSTFGKGELADRLDIPKRLVTSLTRSWERVAFSVVANVANKCGFDIENVAEDNIDPDCARRYISGEKCIMPQRFKENAYSGTITSVAILDNVPAYIRNKAMSYLQITPDCLKGPNRFLQVSHQLNVELLDYLSRSQADPYTLGQNTFFTYNHHPFATVFKGIGTPECYDMLIAEVASHLTQSFKYKLVKCNGEKVVFTKKINPDLEIISTPDVSQYELGFGSIIPAIGNGITVSGKQTRSPSCGDNHWQYEFDLQAARPFYQM